MEKQKALHDFARNDHRLFGQLLVRLDFVKTWSAKRTLAYYRVVRQLVDSLQEEYYDCGYLPDETLPKVPITRIDDKGYVVSDPTVMVHQSKFTYWLKERYVESHKQLEADYRELVRYKDALQWVCSRKERIPRNEKVKHHPRAYYVR